ncbi:MAG: protein kinase [Deltaproteobacteria bacterium]|nr:protein kinase [Deltaproteobacteria bacterium]
MTAQINCSGCNHGYAEAALFCPNCGRPKVRQTSGDALVGKLLGERFQVQALLGQGASGTIYRAEHVTLRRRVAIKVLHAELSRDDLAVERFRREATTVADIDNEHIVEIHDFGRTPDGRLYLAMELLEGETLDTVLAREKQLSVERTADILIQVGEALMEAHAIGYVHRDLRPRNVYLTTRRAKTNFIKLLDFGLAKLVESDTPVSASAQATNLGMTFGDPRYMSPEQARGDRIDRRADIYQLGCVAYEMLTGSPPFTGSRVFDILTKQVTEIPAPVPTRRPGVPLWMEAAITKMLAKDPENRFATTSRMVEALRRGLDTGEVMEDAVARRRESVPPASVSRVMQRMGISGDAPLPALVPPAPAAAVEAPAEPQRRSTGTPKVGVPIIPAPAAESTALPPVVGTIEASKRAKRPSVQPDENNDSQVWYDEGDDPSKSRASSMGDSLYDDDAPPQGRRWGVIIGVLALLVVGGTVAFALTRGGSKTAATGDGSGSDLAAGVPADAAPSTILGEADAGMPDAAVSAVAKGVTRPSTSGISGNSGSRVAPVRDTGGPRRPAGPDFGIVPPGSAEPDNGFAPPGTPPRTNPTANSGVTTVIVPTPPPQTDPGRAGPSGVDGPEDPYGTGGGIPTVVTENPPSGEGASSDSKASFYANLGSSQLANGDTAGAASNFKKALELDAKNVAATIGMGEIALRQGLFGDAIAHLRRAARLAPRSARVFVLLGEAYLNSGNSNEAANNFKKALQLDPDNARARDGYNEASSRVPPPGSD